MFTITEELHIGVTIFFVLSGFLITYRYYQNKNIATKQFFLNRFARIYPVYFVLTTMTFGIMLFQKVKLLFLLQLYLCNITFLRGFSDKYKFSGIGTGWSLTVEEMFYILAPLLFYLIKKSKYHLISLPLLFLFLGLSLGFVFTTIYPALFLNGYLFILDFTFFGRSFEFFVGIALALFVLKNPKKSNKLKNSTYFGVVMLCFFVYLLITIKGFRGNEDRFWSIMVNNYLLPVFAILPLLYGLIYEKTFFNNLLQIKIIQLLGKSSYVFYLIHTGFIYLILKNYIQDRFMQFFILNAIAILIYLYFEEPLNSYIRKIKSPFMT